MWRCDTKNSFVNRLVTKIRSCEVHTQRREKPSRQFLSPLDFEHYFQFSCRHHSCHWKSPEYHTMERESNLQHSSTPKLNSFQNYFAVSVPARNTEQSCVLCSFPSDVLQHLVKRVKNQIDLLLASQLDILEKKVSIWYYCTELRFRPLKVILWAINQHNWWKLLRRRFIENYSIWSWACCR
jgi:hypothetical protein